MAIDFNSTSASLFPRLGRVGYLLRKLNVAQFDSQTLVNDLLGRYPAIDEDLSASLAQSRDGLLRSIPGGLVGVEQQLAGLTLIRMVAADQPTKAASVEAALVELVRQMGVSAQSVAACTVTAAATAIAAPANTGDGTIVVSTQRGDGLVNQNLIAEVGRIQCTTDSRTGGADAGAETFTWTGVPNLASPTDWDWPQGSGSTATIAQASPLINATSGPNLLVNGSFDNWTTTTIDNWTITGTATKETSVVFVAGGNAVKVTAGDTPIIHQLIDSTTGTTAKVDPLQSIAVSLKVRAQTATLTGGVLRIELADAAGVINDDTGSPARVEFALTGVLTSAWSTVSGVIRTPAILPSGLRIRVHVSTTPVSGNLYIDHFAAAPLTALYDGGPGVAVFAGSVAWFSGDGWTVAMTNNRAGATYLSTWNAFFDKLFAMRSLGLMLPTSGAPTIADTLLTS